MIDHISIGVADLEAAGAFYDEVLSCLGFSRMMTRDETIGFGKRYPEFWLNLRGGMAPVDAATGVHICLWGPDTDAIHAFHATALSAGGTDDGAPAPRPQYTPTYYAAFIRDLDGNRIEAVTYLPTPDK